MEIDFKNVDLKMLCSFIGVKDDSGTSSQLRKRIKTRLEEDPSLCYRIKECRGDYRREGYSVLVDCLAR